MTAALTPLSVEYRGITFDNTGPYYLQDVDGLFGAPDYAIVDVPRAGGHGSLLTPQRRGVRLVTLSGVCIDKATRDELFWALRSAMAPTVDPLRTDPLTVTAGGLSLSGDAQPPKFQPTPAQGRWSHGYCAYAVQWRLPDPYLYGPSQTSIVEFSLPVQGLTYPATYPVTYPEQPPAGSSVIYNSGTAPAAAVYHLAGPWTMPGIVNVDTGKYVQYGISLDVGDDLVIDTAQGAAFLNGEYRTPTAVSDLTSDLVIPPGSSTLQALGDGPTWDDLFLFDLPPFGAAVSVTFRPAYW